MSSVLHSGSGACGKGRHYSGYTVYIRSLRVALDLDSDKFRSFNHREKLDSAVQFQFGPVARCLWCVLYIAQGYLYISTGLRQPRERVKFGHRYSSEKVARSL